jgi:hypothetical protein
MKMADARAQQLAKSNTHKAQNFSTQLGTSTTALQDDGCCCQVTSILPEDLDGTTYFITAPGKYVLNQDVLFTPANSNTPAIVILSDNVTLDLCEHTLICQ